MILESLFRAATPENPSFDINSAEAWDMLTAGAKSSTGMNINREKAMTYSPWWRGKNMIARDVGKLPLSIFRRLNPGKEYATTHPAYSMVASKPNEYQTALQFKMTLMGHALDGNGYGYIYRRKGGELIPVSEGGGIYPLDPNVTTPVLVNETLWYVTKVNGEERKLPAGDVLHIKGLGFDGLVGYDVIKVAREGLGLGLARKTYEAKYFKNDASGRIVLQTPGVVGETAALQILKSWNSMAAGLENAHKTALLTHGTTANQLTRTARESQLNEGNEMSVRDIANFLGIPSHKLGDKKNTSYASLDMENLDYLMQCLDFWLCVWESEVWDKLLSEEEKASGDIYAEFERAKLFESDLKTKGEYFRMALAGQAWVSVNEARSAFNMNPKEGNDDINKPLNVGQGGIDNEPKKPGEKTDEPPEDDSEGAAVRAGVGDTVRRMVRRIGTNAERAAKTPADFMAFIDAIPADHGDVVAASLAWAQPLSKTPMAAWVTERIKSALVEFSGHVTAKNLTAQVTIEMARLETVIPGEAVAEFFGGIG